MFVWLFGFVVVVVAVAAAFVDVFTLVAVVLNDFSYAGPRDVQNAIL